MPWILSLMQNLPSQLLLNNIWKKIGIELLQNIRTTEIKNDGDQVLVTENELPFDALLYSTERKPNEKQLENTDIELTERGVLK